MKTKKILILGGHLTPALAVLKELQKKGYSNIMWIGTKYSQTSNKNISPEYKVISKMKIESYFISAGKIWRKVTFKTLFKAIYSFLLIPVGFFHSFYILLFNRPAIVVSFGGYLALPIVFSAKILGIKIITHEQTLTVGMANKIIAKLANRVMISWKQSMSNFPAYKTVYTGNPIRSEIFKETTNKIKISNKLPVIVIMGGNQGSNTINWRLMQILPNILNRTNIIHLTGDSSITKDHKIALAYKNALDKSVSNHYLVYKSIFSEDIGELFAKADLFISRAGANTITELLALGIRSILIPIPWSSQNEQLKNARMLSDIGLATILEQHDDLKPSELLEKIELSLTTISKKEDFDGRPFKETKKVAKDLISLDASSNIVKQIEYYL